MQAILDATASQGEPIQELLVTHGKVCWDHRHGSCLPTTSHITTLPLRSTLGATSLGVVCATPLILCPFCTGLWHTSPSVRHGLIWEVVVDQRTA